MANSALSPPAYGSLVEGYVDLSGELDIIGVVTDGVDTFDAGNIYCSFK